MLVNSMWGDTNICLAATGNVDQCTDTHRLGYIKMCTNSLHLALLTVWTNSNNNKSNYLMTWSMDAVAVVAIVW